MNRHPRLKQSTALILTTLFSVSVLTGCGSSDDRKVSTIGHDDHEEGHDHDHDVDDSVNAEVKNGRLLISDKESNKAYVYSISQNKVIQTIELQAKADALVSSSSGNYALVLDRTNNMVNFYDSGIVIEDHGDHAHPYARDVSKLPLQLNYNKPVHYQKFGQQSAIFFDGVGAADNPIENPQQAAGFALVSDKDIATGKLAYHQLNTNMHGTAEPRGEFVISTGRFDTVGSPLPDTVSVFHRHDDHFHLDKTFATKCAGLHGSGSVTDYSVFACTDGLLSVKQSGTEFSAEKIMYPASIANTQCIGHGGKPTEARIGSFAIHPDHDYLIGTACGQPYKVNPDGKEITPIIWTTDSTSRVVSYKFDADGKHLMLLDNSGKLHILDVAQNYKITATLNLFPAGISEYGHGGPALVINPNNEMVHIVDAANKQLMTVDPEAGKISSSIKLDFTPSEIAWFGVKNEHADEHSHDEDSDHSAHKH